MEKILIALMALGFFVSCSKDEVVKVNKHEITFGEVFVDNATKATDPTYGAVALTSFDVYGTITGTAGSVNIFDGVEVTGNVGDDVWSYDEQYAQYWIPKTSYIFAAVVDADAVTKDNFHMPTALTYNTANQKDLLFATATATVAADGTPSQDPINFTFSHLLSKVQFTVTSDSEGGYYHSVTGISVDNYETGTYAISSGVWTGTTVKSISFGNIEQVTAAVGEKTNATQMLLVPNTATFNVTFTVDLYKNGVKLGTETKTVAVDNDLIKGNAYNFTIDCHVGELIQFTVTNDPAWTNGGNVTVQ